MEADGDRERRMRSTSGRRRRRKGRGKARTALLMPLVILSGSLETGALVRQLREGRAGNKPADFPLHHSLAHYSALPPTILCLLYLFFSVCPFSFFILPVHQGSKAEAKKQQKKVPSLSPSLMPAVWSPFTAVGGRV